MLISVSINIIIGSHRLGIRRMWVVSLPSRSDMKRPLLASRTMWTSVHVHGILDVL